MANLVSVNEFDDVVAARLEPVSNSVANKSDTAIQLRLNCQTRESCSNPWLRPAIPEAGLWASRREHAAELRRP